MKSWPPFLQLLLGVVLVVLMLVPSLLLVVVVVLLPRYLADSWEQQVMKLEEYIDQASTMRHESWLVAHHIVHEL